MVKLDHDKGLNRSMEFTRTVGNTHEGMAHFSGTGPPGEECWHCEHWNGRRRTNAAMIRNGSCTKFQAMTGKKGATFIGTSKACKYFIKFGG